MRSSEAKRFLKNYDQTSVRITPGMRLVGGMMRFWGMMTTLSSPTVYHPPRGDDRGMMIHFCVILYHPPVSSPRESVAIDYHPPVSSPIIIPRDY